MAVMGTEGGDVLATFLALGTYVIAADLVGLPPDEAEAIRVRGMDLGVPMHNLMDRQEKLVGVLHRMATELPAIIGQHVRDAHSTLLVERQDPPVQEIDRRHRDLRQVQLGEGQGAERKV